MQYPPRVRGKKLSLAGSPTSPPPVVQAPAWAVAEGGGGGGLSPGFSLSLVHDKVREERTIRPAAKWRNMAPVYHACAPPPKPVRVCRFYIASQSLLRLGARHPRPGAESEGSGCANVGHDACSKDPGAELRSRLPPNARLHPPRADGGGPAH